MYGIYANICGILMGSMLPYITAPWIRHGIFQWELKGRNDQNGYNDIWLVVVTILKNMSSSMGRMTSHI